MQTFKMIGNVHLLTKDSSIQNLISLKLNANTKIRLFSHPDSMNSQLNSHPDSKLSDRT